MIKPLDHAKVLLVDGQDLLADNLKRSLQQLGYQLDGRVATGAEAWERLSWEKEAPGMGKAFEIGVLTPVAGQLALLLTDITAHRNAVESLRQSQLELAAIYDHAPVLMFLLDRSLRVLRANQAVAKFSGRPPDGLMGALLGGWLGCFPASELPQPCGALRACQDCALHAALRQALQTGKSHHRSELKLNLFAEERRQEITVLVSTALIQVTDPPLVLLCLEDISQRKQVEEQVREQAALLDIAQDTIIVQDLAGRILLWNRGAENLYGWRVEEALGRDLAELLSASNAAELAAARRQVLQREEWSGELRHLTRQKREIVVQSRWALVRDRAGSPKSILSVGTDMTESKRLEAQFLRAQRLETIGTLATGIAHDLNNVLAPILMAVSCLREKPAEQDLLKMLDIMEISAKRGANIIQQLLTFGRGNPGAKAILHPKQLLQEMAKIARETFPKNILLRTSLAPDIRNVRGDATQLHQVLLNLCVNAIDAMPEGGTLTLAVENTQLDDCFAQMSSEAKQGQYVLIRVTDTGTGIPAELTDKIFEPFFTTKAQGKGTGLGLATVANIVKNHGGFVQVTSQAGQGTEFRVYLPVAEEGQEVVAVVEPPGLTPGHDELVLLVDDEAAVRQVVQRTLLKHGYQVLLASDGTEALATYVQHRDRIKVVLIDLIMPHMDGFATIKVLQKLNPAVPIIVASGTLNNLQEIDTNDIKVQAVLSKPFSAPRLLLTLRSVLETV